MKLQNIKYFLILMFLVISKSTYAVYGCYLPNGNVYYEINNNGKYKRAKFVTVGLDACLSGPDDGSCVVNSPNTTGKLGDYDVLYCPLDDHIWVLLFVGFVLMFFNRFQIRT